MLGAIPYTGNKQSLLKEIIPLFPTDHKRFVDCFCGGLSVSLNVEGPVLANDIQYELIDMYNWMSKTEFDYIFKLKDFYKLNDSNKRTYLDVRKSYNFSKRPELLYLLIQHSFSNMIRFNPNGLFTAPFGRRTFTRNTEKRWNIFKNKKDIQFVNVHYSALGIQETDFVYCDPPYLITEAAYNTLWNEDEERKLLLWLDSLHARGIKFALSNVVEHRGLRNDILIDWMKSYNVVFLDKNYKFNQHHSDKKQTVEVFIKNY